MSPPQPTTRRYITIALPTILFLVILSSLYHVSTRTPFSSSSSSVYSSSLSSIADGPITYLPYTFGYAMLLQTLHAYSIAGWKNIIVVDNSWDSHALSQRTHLLKTYPSLLNVIKTPVHLRFSQLQGMIDNLARDDGEEVYLWSHTDVIMLRNVSGQPDGNSDPYSSANACLDMARTAPIPSEGPKPSENPDTRLMIGPAVILFFAYDFLSAVFTEPSSHAQWDPNMPQYGSDCDRYRRVRLAGYTTPDCPYKIAEIVHMRAVLTKEQRRELWDMGKSSKEQIEFLSQVNEASEMYSWRYTQNGNGDGDGEEEDVGYDGIGYVDTMAVEAEKAGGDKYFLGKWGEPFECELDGRVPRFDIKL